MAIIMLRKESFRILQFTVEIEMSDYSNPTVLKVRTATTLSFGSLSQCKKYISYQKIYFQGHNIFCCALPFVPSCTKSLRFMHSFTTITEFELILKSQKQNGKEGESGWSSLRAHLHFALNVTFISQKKQQKHREKNKPLEPSKAWS